jgi:phosphohistidine phosphatase
MEDARDVPQRTYFVSSPMRSRPRFFYRQSGVIPLRRTSSHTEVLLVTTRGSGRWTIPKGVVDLDATPIESAVKEAYEEAGVRGCAVEESVGSYRYRKWGGECVVEVFILEVTEVLENWPEESERTRRWMTPDEAIDAVANEELKKILEEVRGKRNDVRT